MSIFRNIILFNCSFKERNVTVISSIFIWIIALTYFVSCQNNSSKNPINDLAKSYLGSELIKSSKFDQQTDSNISCNQYIQYIYIDSGSCIPCYLNNLRKYALHDFNSLSVETKIIAYTDGSICFSQDSLIKSLGLNYQVILDSLGNIKKQNTFLKYPFLQCFVTDANNTIIWIGSPINSAESWKLFVRTLNSRKIKEKIGSILKNK